ncbi:MAG TPA: IS110 family transposase [Acetobacteraceae bacterium]|nr:IS110 family transposase [Acetobacteraceae bacterium]
MELKRIAVDTSKHVFTVHGEDAAGAVVLRRDVRRGGFEAFMAGLAPAEVVLEACGASHHWGRRLEAMGHRVRLIPPQYVRPFVKRGKTDRADAAAICAAAGRPEMRFVPLKSAERQAALSVLRVRELLVKSRTAAINALRGHAAEFGLVAPQGAARAEALLAQAASEAALPPLAREVLALLGQQIGAIEAQLAAVEARLLALHRESEVSQRLAAIPGVGPVSAITLALSIEADQFANGRHLAAWIGLTPREHSTGGKQRMGGISRAGHERLRSLLVLGATAVIRHARPGSRLATPWLLGLLARKPRKLAAVALANKMARIVWAMMARGEAYRAPPRAGVA